MTTSQAEGDHAGRARAEETLARYPDISGETLDALIHWFGKEASALDVALLASNEAIAEPYRRFRSEHIDPVKGKDVFTGIAILAVISAVFLFIIWRAL